VQQRFLQQPEEKANTVLLGFLSATGYFSSMSPPILHSQTTATSA